MWKENKNLKKKNQPKTDFSFPSSHFRLLHFSSFSTFCFMILFSVKVWMWNFGTGESLFCLKKEKKFVSNVVPWSVCEKFVCGWKENEYCMEIVLSAFNFFVCSFYFKEGCLTICVPQSVLGQVKNQITIFWWNSRGLIAVDGQSASIFYFWSWSFFFFLPFFFSLKRCTSYWFECVSSIPV